VVALLGATTVLLLTAPVTATAQMLAPVGPVHQDPDAAAARAALAASRPGSGGWYWPVGTEDFQDWSGFLDRRGSYVHVAQDMPCVVGHAVYAIADGVVSISRADAGGYGVGGAPGGCIIVAHVTAAGTRFQALYGHVQGLTVKEGQHVVAGQVIATVNGCRHLHFSTHVGLKYRDGNPYAGHVPASWADRGGYVDPVEFLKTNPRTALYEAPALPMMEVSTQAPPQQFGAADGAAYWTEEGGAGSVTWRADLASGARETLGAGVTPPPFDTRRYATTLLATPALGFAVGDRLPSLTLGVVHDTPLWGAEAELDALLTNAAGSPLQGGLLKLQRRDGDAWRNVQLAVTGTDGAAVLLYGPTAATALRVVFAPPATQPAGSEYLVARSPVLTVTPHVSLTTPKAPATADRDDLVTVTGSLTPQHAAGELSVQLVFQRRGAGGRWVKRSTVAAENRNADGSGSTRYVGHARLTPGSWRVQAVHPADAAHAETVTLWRSLTVQ
jgi:murein DD-endopeptidase MepM/ murein hydrolase activator NlpD